LKIIDLLNNFEFYWILLKFESENDNSIIMFILFTDYLK